MIAQQKLNNHTRGKYTLPSTLRCIACAEALRALPCCTHAHAWLGGADALCAGARRNANCSTG
eukprot:2010907-Lingulodinium_polyedra.AAC.1